jgi:hypothetical protein
MIVLTQHEHDELLDHFRKCDDLWSHSGGLWLRSTDDGSAFGLQLVKHEVEGQTVYVPTLHPLEWPEDDVKRYVEKLAWHWTSYLVRTRLQTVLEVECGVDSGKAELVAMKLQEFAWTPVRAPGFTPDLPEVDTTPPDGTQTFLLQGGGYVRVTLNGRSVQATLSLPSGGKHLAFGPPLEGFLTGPVRAHAPSRRWHG